MEESDIKPCPIVEKIFASILTKCNKNCGQFFNVGQFETKLRHEKKCPGKSFTLVDILNLPDGSPLPKEAEKAAAKIVKTKMAESNLPNKAVELNTGSSRVSLFKIVIIYKIFHIYEILNLYTLFNSKFLVWAGVTPHSFS